MAGRIGINSEGHLGLDVKLIAQWDENVSDEIRASVWVTTSEWFWYEADQIAKRFGYSGVYQEGRSGKWAVPHYGNQYPDIDDPVEEKKLKAWAETIMTVLYNKVQESLDEETRMLMEVHDNV